MTVGLELESVSVHYGGNKAVNEASLRAPLGRLTGLIGPNGAGKTSLFNACNGIVRLSTGRVRLFGQDVTGLDPAVRARRGLGRTFQKMQLWTSMTVADNIAIGLAARNAGANPYRQFVAGRGERRRIGAAVKDALAVCGLESLARRKVGALSTGQRRLVELARVYASGFRIVLLDEPSSGLDPAETHRFGEIIQGMVDDDGMGVLLVEHDMSLVLRICEYIHVLDFGEMIFEGSPEEVQASAAVRVAYLGDTAPLGAQ